MADSKLCTNAAMMRIDREQGRFVTIVPRTRAETETFANECYDATVRWVPLTRRRSSRVRALYDVFSVAEDSYQLEEGFRLYWYRSSEKKKRDATSRKERLELAVQKLGALNKKKSRGRRTGRSLLKQAHQIMQRYQVASWLTVTVTDLEEETFTKTSRGRPTTTSTYHRKVKPIPQLVVKKDLEQIARSKAIDGVFPLTTNTQLSAKDVLIAYKDQPNIEKHFTVLKSDFQVAPMFLKSSERIEALMFVVYLADLAAALVQRELRCAMKKNGIQTIRTLPEERPSRTPTWEQIQRLFANHCKYVISRRDKLLRTFWDDLADQQKEVLSLLNVPHHEFRSPG